MRVVNLWNNIARVGVDSSFLGILKSRLAILPKIYVLVQAQPLYLKWEFIQERHVASSDDPQ